MGTKTNCGSAEVLPGDAFQDFLGKGVHSGPMAGIFLTWFEKMFVMKGKFTLDMEKTESFTLQTCALEDLTTRS